MGFFHAYRAGGGEPAIIESAISGSKFSRGDILQADVGSTISKAGPNADTADIFAIALADSNDSINALIPVLLPDMADVFLSDSTAGTAFVQGTEYDVDVSTASRHQVTSSVNTPRVVIVKATGSVLGQSNDSRVLCKFISHSGLIDLS